MIKETILCIILSIVVILACLEAKNLRQVKEIERVGIEQSSYPNCYGATQAPNSRLEEANKAKKMAMEAIAR